MIKNLLLLITFILNINYLIAQPSAPTGLKASTESWRSFNQVVLTWNSSGNSRYYVYKKFGAVNDSGEFLKIPMRLSRTSFKDKLVYPGWTFSYFVTAFNSDGESTHSDTVQITVNKTNASAYIYGNISDENSGSPIYKAHISIVPYLSWHMKNIQTDSAGFYSSDIVPGDYFLFFNARGYYPEFYNNVLSLSDAEKLSIEDGDTVMINTSLEPKILPAAYKISGWVTDSSGKGLRARVQSIILNRGYFDHKYRGTVSDTSGYYSFKVNEGDSLVIFAVPFDHDYLPEFYDDKKEFAEAEKLVISDDMTDINFILDKKPVYNNSISGRVTDLENNGLLANLTIFKLNERGHKRIRRTTMTDSLGNYSFTDLVPGNYILLAIPFDKYIPGFFRFDGTQTLRWKEADSIDVADLSHINGIDFKMMPLPDSGFARISGTIKDNFGIPINGAIIYAVNDNSIISGYSTTNEKGNFTINDLIPGSYTISNSKIDYEPSVQSNVILDYSSNQQKNINMTMTTLIATSAKSEKKEEVKNYALFQNFPNPFNPVTTITYQVPEPAMVKLSVYNIIGQEIAEIVNAYKPAGIYNEIFDASELNSGIYFYKLSAGKISIMRKMVVVK